MRTKRVEKLMKGDEIVLWANVILGEIPVTVDEVHVRVDGTVRVTTEEIEWASLLVPLGTEVDLAE